MEKEEIRKEFKEIITLHFMNKKGNSTSTSIFKIFSFIIAFILGGTGLAILFNAESNAISIIGGFALIGIAISIIYKILEK